MTFKVKTVKVNLSCPVNDIVQQHSWPISVDTAVYGAVRIIRLYLGKDGVLSIHIFWRELANRQLLKPPLEFT